MNPKRILPFLLCHQCYSSSMATFDINIELIQNDDISDLSIVLRDTYNWLSRKKSCQWSLDDLSEEKLLDAYGNDEIYVGYQNDQPVCAVIIQKIDNIFWQGSNHDDAVYLHKLAVIEELRGSKLSEKLVELVCQRAAKLGKYFVRLDCRANREKLCIFYNNQGFQHQGNIMVGNDTHALYQKTI